MKNLTKNATKRKITIKTVSRIGLAIGIFLVGFAVFDYIKWVNGTMPDPMTTDANASSVKGTQTCQPIDTTDIWKDVQTNRSWFLVGDEFSDEEQKLVLTAQLDESRLLDQESLRLDYAIIDTDSTGSLSYDKKEKSYTASFDATSLDPGTYNLSITATNACSSSTAEPIPFNVSYPVYVVWSIDWEGSDVKQEYLDNMNTIANTYNVPMTHFFNPRIYLPSVVSTERANALTQYVLDGKETRGDAIGLHLHMFPDMVSAAGVEPQYSPAWGWTRTDGYDILVSGYSYDKMNTILDWSVDTFENHGLEAPTMFRAGGWFADEGTLRVLEDNDFVLDSSGRTSYTLGTNNVETHWNLLETTQPYHPSYSNQNIVGTPGMDLWEFPNNGGDSWSFSKDEMYARFRANYAGGASTEMKIVTYLSHPDWFNVDKPKMESLFTDIGNEGFSSDKGPVIYTTLEDLYHIRAEVE